MKLKMIVLGMLLAGGTATYGQATANELSTDLKKQQKILVVEKRLVDNKLKLEEYHKSLTDKQAALEKSLDQSKASADRNMRAAEKLQGSTEGKRASKNARKAARQAEKDAKAARKAASRKTDLENDIKSLEKKIEKDEQELDKLKGSA